MSGRSPARARAVRRLVLLVSLAGAPVAAEPLERGQFRLEWSAPPDCPSGLSVLTRMEALLGEAITTVLHVPLAASGRVRRTEAERFELSLETFQAEQRFVREMQAPSCGELTDAAALVLALAVDPALSERQAPAGAAPLAGSASSEAATSSPGAPEPAATGAPAVEAPATRPTVTRTPPPAPDTKPDTKPPTSNHLGFFGAASAVADLGSVASFAVGPAMTLGLRLPAFELDLEATWLPPRRSFSHENPAKGGDIALLTATLRPCGLLSRGALEAGLCGALDLGDIWGTGVGTVEKSTRHSFWVAAGASLLGRYRVTRCVALRLAAGLLLPLQDLEFSLENVGTVYVVPDVVARFGLGVEAHLD